MIVALPGLFSYLFLFTAADSNSFLRERLLLVIVALPGLLTYLFLDIIFRTKHTESSAQPQGKMPHK